LECWRDTGTSRCLRLLLLVACRDRRLLLLLRLALLAATLPLALLSMEVRRRGMACTRSPSFPLSSSGSHAAALAPLLLADAVDAPDTTLADAPEATLVAQNEPATALALPAVELLAVLMLSLGVLLAVPLTLAPAALATPLSLLLTQLFVDDVNPRAAVGGAAPSTCAAVSSVSTTAVAAAVVVVVVVVVAAAGCVVVTAALACGLSVGAVSAAAVLGRTAFDTTPPSTATLCSVGRTSATAPLPAGALGTRDCRGVVAPLARRRLCFHTAAATTSATTAATARTTPTMTPVDEDVDADADEPCGMVTKLPLPAPGSGDGDGTASSVSFDSLSGTSRTAAGECDVVGDGDTVSVGDGVPLVDGWGVGDCDGALLGG
jgi:hypothetical protein